MEHCTEQFAQFEAKMRDAGVREAAMRAFKHNYQCLLSGDTGMIPEASIEPVLELPRLDDVTNESADPTGLLAAAVVLKLNGGLGTSMGLEGAKSLLPVKDGLTFLDLIARQIMSLRQKYRLPLSFVLMNSFSTSADTLQFLRNYPELGPVESLELL